MSDDRIDGYARGLFELARAEGTLDEVEDELFRFARSFESSEELRRTLTDETIPVAKRLAVIQDLLGVQATATTVQLISMVVGSGRAKDLPRIADRLVQRASSSKKLEVAEVRTAWPMTEDERTRLAAALANATGKQLNIKVIVDPSVLGGVVATIGDDVIDGSIRTRLDQLKSRL
jgi:F-type H+-transporting ATPase subunit delta